MKVIVETVEVKKSRPTTSKNKKTEIPLATLWEQQEQVFTPEDNLPPEKWNFLPPK